MYGNRSTKQANIFNCCELCQAVLSRNKLFFILEGQVFITLMKLRQNYTNLHLGELFH